MFHVYYVNDGCMLVPQTSGIGGRVLDLQQSIRDVTHVEVLDQVLYLNNGEQVHGDAPLSSYAQFGTETAPFFLLRRHTRFDPPNYVPPMPDRDDLVQRQSTWQAHLLSLERSNTAPVNEFLRHWQYVQQFDERLYRTCAKYADDHVYIYQGWKAMLKNLIESASRMQKLVERSAKKAECLEAMRERGIADLSDFDDVLATLAKIMVPSQLLAPAFRSPAVGTNSASATTTSSSSSGTSGGGSGGDEVSLYDWIATTDTSYSPSQMAAYLIDDLKNTDDTDLRAAQEHILYVNTLLADDKYRNIGGVDRRIATIREKMKSIEANHREAAKTTDMMLKEVATTAVAYHKAQLGVFAKQMNDSYAQATNIMRSKEELMRNINTRVSNWIQRCYERLGLTRKSLMVFEGKYNGLRDRLKLVRQIREAPILYVTAVAEVIRRDALQKEFSAWFAQFAARCTQFIDGENKLRADFYAKLGEHFLRNIFFDLSDRMPDFRPHCAPFDRNLPRVAISHLRDLRKTFPDKHELLNVTRPRVYERLHVADPTATESKPVAAPLAQAPSAPTLGDAVSVAGAPATTSSAVQTAGGGPLRREESFFVREPTNNIDTINENFPSQNWLSEEHIDMSPGSQLFITTPGAGGLAASNSNASLHVDTTSLASPADLGPLSDFALSAYGLRGSRPIATGAGDATPIGSNDDGNGGTTIVMDVSTSTVRQPLSSAGSSPDFERAGSGPAARPHTLPAPGESDMSNSLEICSPSEINELIRAKCSNVSATVREIYTFFTELRESVTALRSEMEERRVADASAVRVRLVELEDERRRASEEREVQRRREAEDSAAETEKRHKELSDIVEHERYLRKEKEKELDEQRRVAEKLNEDLLTLMKAKDDLSAELLRSDQERQRLREQLDAEPPMDYLQIELKAVEQLLKRELTAEEVSEIKREIEKCKISKSEVSSLSSDGAPASTPSPQPAGGGGEPSGGTSKIRSDYEKAFRSKMELIVRGVEEKKNKEMAAQRDEIEAEMRKEADGYTRRLKERIAELEERVDFFERVDSEHRKRDAAAVRATADAQLQVTLANESIKIASCDEIAKVERLDGVDMTASVATVAAATADAEPERDDLASARPPSSQSVGGATLERVTQTRIRGHDMELMISLRNIHEGCSVLIMWNMAHNAYMIFSTSPQLYIVREPQHMIRNKDPATRRNWMFVTVTEMEVCQIRKVENRYNLPVNTRFHWVTVVPLDLEHTVSAAAASPRANQPEGI